MTGKIIKRTAVKRSVFTFFDAVGARIVRPGVFALKRRTGSARASRAGFRRLRAAGTVRLRGAGGQEVALPPLAGHPRRGKFTAARDRKQIFPHTVEKFVCDYVAAVRFCA